MMIPRCIIIDGYNVIRNTPALAAAERQGLPAGRDALLDLVSARYRHTPHRVLVVFDGAGIRETTAPLRCGVQSQVIYTRAGETADVVILRLVEQLRATCGEPTIVTNDWEVRDQGSARGAAAASVSDLGSQVHAAPRHLRHRARHHAFVRAQEDVDDDMPRIHPRKGNPRRAPRRRRGPPSTPPL